MKIQVNSDKTIAVSAKLTQFVEEEVSRILHRFAARLTRVEIHLSDIDNVKKGQADNRCLLEARPAGAQPRTASAHATKVDVAVTAAAKKMQRALTTYFGRMDGPVAKEVVSTPKSGTRRPRALKAALRKTAVEGVKKSAVAKKVVAVAEVEEMPAHEREHSRAKKRIYQARRKPWPTR